jgi:tRNA nucleotidyltransferase (CCA-adding enzyme)
MTGDGKMQDEINLKFPEKELFVRLFGDKVHVVGGGVRDSLRGTYVPEDELDLLILQHPVEDIEAKLSPHGKVDLVGRSFGVIKFTVADRTYDIALPRRDAPKNAELRGHKDFIISADPELPIEKDLERRDFRCNSIAARLSDGRIVDPLGGREDIGRKQLRLTNPQAFPDDPLRIIRAARFASVLEYSIDAEIYRAAKDVDLSGLSVERINEELFRILLRSPRPSRGLEELFMLGALRQLFPELFRLTLSIQDSRFHPEKDRYGHHTVWQHTKISVDQANRLADLQSLEKPAKLALLLAALFHDVGKPTTATWEYKRDRMVITNNGHDIAGEQITRHIFERFKIFSWDGFDLRKLVLPLIRTHHRASELWQNREVVTKKAFNRLAAEVNGEIALVVYLDAADRAGRDEAPIQGLDEEARWLLQKFEELNINKESIKPLIMGRDLIGLGVEPGPYMGLILKELYQRQLDGEFEDRDSGIETAKNLLAEGKK